MSNLIIGLGNAGTQIVKCVSNSELLSDVKLYAIDSVASEINMDNIHRITHIPIISDDKSGSGRNRDRGQAMFKFHEKNGTFDDMYLDAMDAKSPVFVITSAAGGTGSGSVVPLCETLSNKHVSVIPIIVFPNMDDPIAYHLNTNDLLIELQNIGIQTYSVFRNAKDTANYEPINQEIVEFIEIVLGRRYDTPAREDIDDSDLDVILQTPGRIMAVTVSETDIPRLTKMITNKVFSGFQPAFTEEESNSYTFMKAFGLSSMFADQDFGAVFADIKSRIKNEYDEYRNIANINNDGKCTATAIIAGLPRPEIKEINADYKETQSIASGMNRSVRPSFINRKKATIVTDNSKNGDAISKFKWD